MRRLLVLLALATATCSPLPAQEAQSSQPLMVPLSLCEEQLTLLEQTAQQELAQQESEWQARLTRLASDYEQRLRRAVEAAAADTARPLMVELAGVRAERDSWKAAVVNARVTSFAGWLFGAACLGLLVVSWVTN